MPLLGIQAAGRKGSNTSSTAADSGIAQQLLRVRKKIIHQRLQVSLAGLIAQTIPSNETARPRARPAISRSRSWFTGFKSALIPAKSPSSPISVRPTPRSSAGPGRCGCVACSMARWCSRRPSSRRWRRRRPTTTRRSRNPGSRQDGVVLNQSVSQGCAASSIRRKSPVSFQMPSLLQAITRKR